MQVPAKLWSLTATEALSLIKKDRLTVEDYAKALVSRIESRNSVVKAWKYFGKPNALLHTKQARLIFC
jgi:Asp-tRNA(Asn)/Glu-tRNA(Gln) amidotransferase A subunit family amidase